WTFMKTVRSCSGREVEYFYRVKRDGTIADAGSNVVSDSDNGCMEGRRPPMLEIHTAPWLSSLGACFAEIAHMEMAAVLAFDDLDRQLRALSAPWPLLMRVAKARADEVAHAELSTKLARRFGAHPMAPRV